jgi:ribonuclease HI
MVPVLRSSVLTVYSILLRWMSHWRMLRSLGPWCCLGKVDLLVAGGAVEVLPVLLSCPLSLLRTHPPANKKQHPLPTMYETAQTRRTKLLEPLYTTSSNLKDTIYLYKVKAQAGILGNECANAIAKCSMENKSGQDIHINTGVHPHSSIFWPARVKTPFQSSSPTRKS